MGPFKLLSRHEEHKTDGPWGTLGLYSLVLGPHTTTSTIHCLVPKLSALEARI